jgi:hypothetical protein
MRLTTIATNQKFHLQPFATVRKPPMIGPTQGPTATITISCVSKMTRSELTRTHHPNGHGCPALCTRYEIGDSSASQHHRCASKA